MALGAGAQSYTYDAFGRRASRTVGAAITTYVYDGLNAVQERAGTTITATNLDGLEVDQHYARTTSAGSSSYLTDPLETTLALSGPSGAITTSYTYSPYGSTTVTGAASGNPYQFTGRENDGDGLTYMRARYESTARGQFISPDPAGLRGDGAASYAYVRNSPATRGL